MIRSRVVCNSKLVPLVSSDDEYAISPSVTMTSSILSPEQSRSAQNAAATHVLQQSVTRIFQQTLHVQHELILDDSSRAHDVIQVEAPVDQ